ncbi:recombinase family protein [Salimicrobium salexigens]|uniref:Site-specific DNA recombinase n=1 Tax=Salimicrobium salexigens TaxID=908941 RepID=A0ABY1KQW4_9BACI|nr:recombinase family protein [Salimicrobium salexigens]SIS66531.1 Site-specific DNA recombinase [Salimicrobium salexigens]
MKFGYARVSTRGQDLEGQIQALKKEGCEEIYQEFVTGTKREKRKEFNELIDRLDEGDTLAVTKLDRFARSANDATSIIEDLFERGVRVHVLNMGIIENTPTGRLIFNIMTSFAQFERDMIVERTQDGKALAKKRPDFREGRPKKYNKKQIDHALQLLETQSYREVEQLTGISMSTLKRAKRTKDSEK